MTIVYPERDHHRFWCADCDRFQDECKCEAWAEEAREERNQLRRDALWTLEVEHPGRARFRASYVRLCRVMEAFHVR